MSPVNVYISCPAGNAVDGFELDTETGKLTPSGRQEGQASVGSVAQDRARGLLYAGLNQDAAAVASLRVGTGGLLTAVGTAPLHARTAYLSVDPHGRWLFNASYHDDVVLALPLDADGTPGDRAPVRMTPGGKAHCVLPSPDGAFVYATSLGDDRIVWYRPEEAFEEAGHVDSAPGSGPRHLRFSASGDVVYALHEMTGTVAVYTRDAGTGALEEIQVVGSVPEELGLVPGHARGSGRPDPGPDAIWCSDVQLGAGGRYLFTTERSSSTVTAFAVDPDNGTLTFLRTTDTETQPRGAGVDPSGSFLLVCGQRSDHVSVYRIGEDGLLETTDRASTAEGPMWIETLEPVTAP